MNRRRSAGVRAAIAALVGVAILTLLWPRRAQAHEVGLSSGVYAVSGPALTMDLSFSRRELLGAVPEMDDDRDGVLTSTELDRAKPALDRAIAEGMDVRADGQPCARALESARLMEEDGLFLRVEAWCPTGAAKLRLEPLFLDRLPEGHRHIVHATGGAAPVDAVLFRKNRSLELALTTSGTTEAPGAARVSRGAFGMFVAGIGHILTGYDHLVFLLALVLLGGSVRTLFGIVTAFTVAHSITLGVAAFDVWSPNARVIGPAIALSIAYVGVENYFAPRAEQRWRIALSFGLVHGFGFAAALRGIGLPHAEVPARLLSFHLGVLTGQLGVLAIALPLVLFARKRAWFNAVGVKVLGAATAAAGIAWFVARITGRGA